MKSPVLKTKLNMPLRRSGNVTRDKIVRRIKLSDPVKLILISAPAGFGKTTTACQIIDEKEMLSAWLSLDANDNELKKFLIYFVEAVKTINPIFLPNSYELIQSINSVGIDYVKTTIINEIFSLSENFYLVLDDFHLIVNPEIISFLRFFLSNMPPNMCLIITTREDPDFPLAKLRARNEMMEIRAGELRFNHEETAAFFRDKMAVKLSDALIRRLEERTEGWIAGIQLSAISLKTQSDKREFIENFSDNHYYIMDYLLEEVLKNLSSDTKNFLLKTAILENLNGSLCDAMLDAKPGYAQAVLEKLKKANIFLIELDNERKWYRYHHLFSELLRQKFKSLSETNTDIRDEIKTLHKRAALWFRKSGDVFQAVKYAVKAEEYVTAAEMTEMVWSKMDMTFQTESWLELVKMLPEEQIRKRPVLNTGYAWANLDIGNFEGVKERLNEAWKMYEIKMGKQSGKVSAEHIQVSDFEQFNNLPATIASALAYYYSSTGDEQNTLFYAEKALESHRGTNFHRRGIINILFGFSLWRMGNLEAAYGKIKEATEDFKRINQKFSELSVQIVLAQILIDLGRLKTAEMLCFDSLKKTKEKHFFKLMNASFYLILSRIMFIKKDLDAAEKYLLESKKSGDISALPDWEHKWYMMKSQLESVRGEFDKALDSLKMAEELYFPNPIPDVWTIQSLKMMNYIKKGDLKSAEEVSESEEQLAEYIGKYTRNDQGNNDNNHLLVEPLTKRELEILTLISQGLSNKQIAERLYLALSTVKGYNQNIFAKLLVKSRVMAVNKARALGMI